MTYWYVYFESPVMSEARAGVGRVGTRSSYVISAELDLYCLSSSGLVERIQVQAC